MIAERFMIAANLMTDVAMRSTLQDMGNEGGCEPGTMVLMSRLAKQFYRRGDEDQRRERANSVLMAALWH